MDNYLQVFATDPVAQWLTFDLLCLCSPSGCSAGSGECEPSHWWPGSCSVEWKISWSGHEWTAAPVPSEIRLLPLCCSSSHPSHPLVDKDGVDRRERRKWGKHHVTAPSTNKTLGWCHTCLSIWSQMTNECHGGKWRNKFPILDEAHVRRTMSKEILSCVEWNSRNRTGKVLPVPLLPPVSGLGNGALLFFHFCRGKVLDWTFWETQLYT